MDELRQAVRDYALSRMPYDLERIIVLARQLEVTDQLPEEILTEAIIQGYILPDQTDLYSGPMRRNPFISISFPSTYYRDQKIDEMFETIKRITGRRPVVRGTRGQILDAFPRDEYELYKLEMRARELGGFVELED